MAYMPQPSFEEIVKQTSATVKSLTVAELKNVLRKKGLGVSGIKAELQMRIISEIQRAEQQRDRALLDELRGYLTPGRMNTYSNTYPSPYSNNTPNPSLSPQYAPTPSRLPPPNGYNMGQRNPFIPKQTDFQDSPFYTIRQPLSTVQECKARETTRDTARVNLVLSQDVVNELVRPDSNARVMVFCAAEGKPAEIAFPHQVELKCNDNEIKANLRGLKNKPGSTLPVDITTYLRKKSAGLQNSIEMTYALTQKEKPAIQKFYLLVQLVQKKPIDSLVRELRQGKKFLSKEQVVREMQKQAADPDIVATSSIMSLKDPTSYTRIKTPCRGLGCQHSQCFDAKFYLELQQQAPTWLCPVCNKTAPWDRLVLDMYMVDILDNTSQDTEEVTVEPNGQWHLGKGEQAKTNGSRDTNPTPPEDDDGSDDALEIIEDPIIPPSRRDYARMALTPSSVRTPPLGSRDESRAPSATASTSRKRPREEVIDLTLSDDDDDQPPVKQQRPSMSSSTNSFRARPPDRNGTGTPTGSSGSGAFSFSMHPPLPTLQHHPLPYHDPPPGFDFDASRYGPY